jgi:hypothetical protein
MSRVRSATSWDVVIAVREGLTDRPSPEVRVTFEFQSFENSYTAVMTPAFARKLSRRLKKYADLADPPKRRSAR